MKRFYSPIFITLILLSTASTGQIVVTTNNNGNQLAQNLAGAGVTISNVTINCPGTSAGTFQCNNCNFGMQSGIALTTGDLSVVVGPNNIGSAGTDNTAAGDPALTTLAGAASTHNACILEFDLQVLSDSVEFKYFFGSEEYPEYVNSGFNDAFAFFISGPGIAGQQNMALIPGTTTPVTINNVNNGYSPICPSTGPCNNCAYYTDNCNGTELQLDGFTTVLIAKRKNLQPCQTYHLKLTIADAGDPWWDSGVFLQENSLTSNFVSVDTAQTDVPGSSTAMEGCVAAHITFRMQYPVSTPTTVNFVVGGTATQGVDYNNIGNSVVIPAGDTVATINISAINDGLTEGAETIKVYLTNLCNNLPYDSSELTLIDPWPVTASPDTTICTGGQAVLVASGIGVFSWTPTTGLATPGDISTIASPPSTTTYVVTADIGICQSTDTVKVTVISAPFSVSAGPDLALCGSPSVQLNAAVTGNPVNGIPFSYDWSPATSLSDTAIANPTASPTVQTTYAVQVESGGCVAKDTVSVTLGNLSITATSTNETCFGYSNGTAAVASVGQPPYQIVWSNSATAANITGLGGGNYSVTVTDNTGCSVSASTVVSSPTQIVITPTTTDVLCNAGNNGAINISIAGGFTPYSFNWGGGVTTQNRTNLSSGSYTVVVTDSNSCTASSTSTITQPSALVLSTAVTDVMCFGGNDGAIALTVTGGTTSYGFDWGNGVISQNRTALIAGPYSVTVTDANQCTATTSAMVTEPATPLAVTNTYGDIACYAGNTGWINLTAAGATPTYQYLWAGGATAEDPTNMIAGNYSVTVTDAHGCSATLTQTLIEPSAPVSFSFTSANISCYSGNDGMIDVLAAGGTPTYTYTWSTGGTGTTMTGATAGTYTVSISDAQSCLVDTTFILSEPTQLVLSISAVDVICYGQAGGSATIAATGATTPYAYSWSEGSTTTSLNGLLAGGYSVTVNDANNCSATAATVVSQPSQLSASATSTPTLCPVSADGSVTSSASGGVNPYQFRLELHGVALQTNSIGQFDNLSSGTYDVNVNDSHNCPATAQVVVASPAPDVFDFVSEPISCHGPEFQNGIITIDPVSTNSPYQYSLDGSELVLTSEFINLASGMHTVHVINKNGCATDTTLEVIEPPLGILEINPSDTTIQLGDQIQLSNSLTPYGNGAIVSYSWTPSEGLSCTDCDNPVMMSYAKSNEYTLTVEYNSGCIAAATTKIIGGIL